MKEQIEQIRKTSIEEVKNAKDIKSLNDLKVKYLGKKGELTQVLRGMGALTPEERPIIGGIVNKVRELGVIFKKLSRGGFALIYSN